jgi:DNA (cytosine-5)-methyltransferase 1
MPFPRQVLKYHFPKSLSYEDITKTNFTIHRGNIDILTGGFPCQPYSSAGKRLGKEDERHLWPHMLRAIQEIEPTYVVGENVRGLTNWNGGVVFEEVCADLESCGYEVQPILLPACAVGAPHRRDRVWFVAYSKLCSNRISRKGRLGMDRSLLERCEWEEKTNRFDINNNDERITSDIERIRCEQREFQIESNIGRINAFNDTCKNDEQGNVTDATKSKRKNNWNQFSTQPPICGGDDGLPTELDGITFSKWRQESIKGYGNAICPQVAYEIFKVIEQLNYDTISR